ncbi:ornithine aminotransferase [Pseudomonas syringae pv. actinidiae str. M302091]|uniref:aspartate aminotransferase family protein n=1 Tax=Pseudomonas syringae TaxID=317 RepID=UPI000209463E|nr:aminotransferase class III-fold pyridoxal phosphate-dependent enzyme [Pseudomonas syringae]EGH66969.1 ornithine aminotransferase [Pseudomonas syringae pv. actinidiae str. M302091]
MNTELTGRSVPVPKQSERKSAFVDRYGAVFGRQQGLMLKMSGLSASEARGDGAWVEDTQGGRWLDFGSFGVHLLGHSHSGVVSALVEQIQRFGLSTKILSNEPIVLAAERLLVMAGPEKDKVIFGNTGSEVVEAALKLARIVTGRRRVIAFEQAYHGRTAAALSVSHGYMRHAGLLTEGDVVFCPIDDLDAVANALEAGDIAAIIIEPIQGEGGIRPVENEFLRGLGDLAQAFDCRLIFDEIQTGLGRIGSLRVDVPCDILLLGKVLGGGVFPISAALFTSKLFDAAARDPVVHASSFAGSALAGAVVNAVLDVVSAPDFTLRVQRLGDRVLSYLRQRLADNPLITDIRGQGLMIGVEFKRLDHVGEMIIEAAKRHLLLAFCLTDPKVLRLYPPAVISDADLETGLEHFCQSVEAITRTEFDKEIPLCQQ